MATNVTGSAPHQSRRIRWKFVALLAGALVMIPISLWYYGVVSRTKTPDLTVVGGNPMVTKDIVEKPQVEKKVELPEKPKEEPIDKRWEEAKFRQQMALFDTGWREYFALRQSAMDRKMQRTDLYFKQDMKTTETRYDEKNKALRSVSDGNLYNNTEKTGTGINSTLAAVMSNQANNGATQETGTTEGQPQIANQQLANAGPLSTNYLSAPRSPHILYAGTHLPITLDQWANSDAPGGSWVGHVNTDVLDTLYSKEVLIPAGTRVVGVADPSMDNNEQPVLNLKLTLLQFPANTDYPNGAYLAAPGINAQMQNGIQGIDGPVNHHFFQRYGSAAVLSLVAAGVRMATYQTSYDGYGYQMSPQDAAAQGFGQVLGQVIGEELRRKLRIRPTVSVPVGYNFVATFQQIQEFPGPWRRN